MPGLGRRNASSCGRVGVIRYDTPMASPAADAMRAHWDGAGHWQRRAWATHAISALDSPVTCHRGSNSSAGGDGLDQLDDDVLAMPVNTCARANAHFSGREHWVSWRAHGWARDTQVGCVPDRLLATGRACGYQPRAARGIGSDVPVSHEPLKCTAFWPRRPPERHDLS